MTADGRRQTTDSESIKSGTHGQNEPCSFSRSPVPPLSRSISLLAWPLAPLGVAFLGLTRLKASLYASGALRKASLPAPSISVGNLTFGGTGKTPFTLFLAKLAQERGLNPAIVLRGYGRKSKGARLVTPESTVAEVGDEALLYAQGLPGVSVVVAERREEALRVLPSLPGLFILDDAFQHQRLHRDADILLVDASRPQDFFPPPVGRLRECASACRRADLLVVTRSSFAKLPERLRSQWGDRPRIEVRFGWSDLLGPDGAGSLGALRLIPTVAFAGVGNPASFFTQAKVEGVDLRAEIPFPDHAEPTPQRMEQLRAVIRVAGAQAVLTTEKDAVKWLPLWKEPVPLYFVRLTAEVDDPNSLLEALLLRVARAAP